MAKRRSTLKLFLDSSVLFTAVNSSFGGSAKLFTLPEIKLYVSKIVLHEVENNVRKKLGEMYLERFFRLAGSNLSGVYSCLFQNSQMLAETLSCLLRMCRIKSSFRAWTEQHTCQPCLLKRMPLPV